MSYAFALTTLVIIGIVLQMINFYMSTRRRHRAHCWLTIVVALIFGTTEIMMALHDPAQTVLFFSSVLYLWMLWQGVTGLLRGDPHDI